MPPFLFSNNANNANNANNSNGTNQYNPDINDGREEGGLSPVPIYQANIENNTVDRLNSQPEQSTSEHIIPDQGERFEQARRSAWIVYFVLVTAGLVMGSIALLIIAWLLQHFGLTDVPVQVDTHS